MKRTAPTDYLLPSVAYLTWAAVSGFTLYLLLQRDAATETLITTTALVAVNAIAMWASMADQPAVRWQPAVGLTIQLASALALGALLKFGFLPIYTVVWMSMVGVMAPWRLSLALLAGVLAAWYFIMRFIWGESGAIFTVVLYGTFHLFAVLTARNVRLADTAKQEVEALNRELMATQQLLAEASKQSERTRIARNLHDLLGHHLTALSIQLQIAERVTEGEAKASVSEARALARLLLSDVRDAVSTLREEDTLDLAASLAVLIDNIPALEVSLDMDESLNIKDVQTAETLLRCVQESLTNTLRHANATQSWIQIGRDGQGIALSVRDNGRTAPPLVREGNGLTGLRERVAQLNGSLTLTTDSEGVALSVWLPGTSQ
jgi:two-component system sensor histidine kinase DesK